MATAQYDYLGNEQCIVSLVRDMTTGTRLLNTELVKRADTSCVVTNGGPGFGNRDNRSWWWLRTMPKPIDPNV